MPAGATTWTTTLTVRGRDPSPSPITEGVSHARIPAQAAAGPAGAAGRAEDRTGRHPRRPRRGAARPHRRREDGVRRAAGRHQGEGRRGRDRARPDRRTRGGRGARQEGGRAAGEVPARRSPADRREGHQRAGDLPQGRAGLLLPRPVPGAAEGRPGRDRATAAERQRGPGRAGEARPDARRRCGWRVRSATVDGRRVRGPGPRRPRGRRPGRAPAAAARGRPAQPARAGDGDGTPTAEQTTQNTAVQNTDATTTSVTAAVATIAGQQIVAQQLLEQSPINMDPILLADLAADYATKLDVFVINNNAANKRGLLNASGVNAITYTDASPTVGELYSKVGDGIQQIHTQRFLPPDKIFMHPRRWAWFTVSLDTNGRPLVVPVANMPQNVLAAMGDG